MGVLIPPPPHGKDEGVQQDWFVRVRNAINKLGSSITWSLLDKSGSNLIDLETKNHSSLDNIQGGSSTERYHVSNAQYSKIASGINVTITTAKVTSGGANGSMTFENGILTSQTQAT